MTELKLCKDCKHYFYGFTLLRVTSEEYDWCMRDCVEVESINLVSGETRKLQKGRVYHAGNERHPDEFREYEHVVCGEKGIYYGRNEK